MSNEIIQEVLHVSYTPLNVPAGYFVVELEDDLSNGFTIDHIDSILLTLLTENDGLSKPFTYLNDSFLRCQKQKKVLKTDSTFAKLFNELDKLIIGYGLVAFQVEEFALHGNFKNYIAMITESVDRYCDFLAQIVQRAIIEETVLELLNNVFPVLLDYLIKDLPHFDLTLSRLPSNVLTVFELFLSFKPVAAVFTKMHNFFGRFDCPSNQFEKTTILGPILSLSPLNFNVAMKNYGELTELSPQQKTVVHESLQAEHKVILNRLFLIMDKIVRGGIESRTDVISYLSQIVNKNHLRRGDHSQQNKLATNAFMCNITLILIRFSQPFLDVSYKKIDKIDINYFNNISIFIDLTDETRLNSDIKEADKFHDENKSSAEIKPNFISDCFFLTLTYLHYGIGGTLLYDEKLAPQIKKIKEELDRVKKASEVNTFMGTFLKAQIKQLEKTLNYITAIKNSMKGFFSHRFLQLDVFDFICGASTFLMRVIDPSHQYPFKSFDLPLIPDQVGLENVDNADYLRENAPIPFKYYPEFVVEGAINYSSYISQYGASPLFRNPRLNSFLELATTILRCPELVSNPHLKGKLVQLLSIGAMPLTDNSPGFMLEIFEGNEFVSKHLLYSLLDFYVIVEKTGSSSQFYDKFNSRYSISIILEELYNKVPKYKEQLLSQAKSNVDFFTRFVARMLNDLTFLLDEGLTSLSDVHNLGNEISRLETNNGTTQSEEDSNRRQDLESRLASAQRQAKSSCGLASKSLELFELFTKDIPESFIIPELVDRLASMLNYNLESLVGPKCGELKVSNPAQYSFNPKKLLTAVCTIFINLSNQDEFISAVARDARSFNVQLFNKACDILNKRTGLLSDEKCEILINFAQNAQDRKDQEEEEDLEYKDAPDEFLDPLMYTIMKDPVMLPTSKVNIDKSTIRAHLLSDSTDPFNRMPLKFEDVIPNDELKQKILEFKRQKKLEKSK